MSQASCFPAFCLFPAASRSNDRVAEFSLSIEGKKSTFGNKNSVSIVLASGWSSARPSQRPHERDYRRLKACLLDSGEGLSRLSARPLAWPYRPEGAPPGELSKPDTGDFPYESSLSRSMPVSWNKDAAPYSHDDSHKAIRCTDSHPSDRPAAKHRKAAPRWDEDGSDSTRSSAPSRRGFFERKQGPARCRFWPARWHKTVSMR